MVYDTYTKSKKPLLFQKTGKHQRHSCRVSLLNQLMYIHAVLITTCKIVHNLIEVSIIDVRLSLSNNKTRNVGRKNCFTETSLLLIL